MTQPTWLKSNFIVLNRITCNSFGIALYVLVCRRKHSAVVESFLLGARANREEIQRKREAMITRLNLSLKAVSDRGYASRVRCIFL